MKKAVIYTLFGLFAYCGFLIHSVPASVVWKYAPPIKGLVLSGFSGTLWKGQIQDVNIQGAHLNQLNWEFQPSELFRGNLALAISLGHARSPLSGRAKLSLNGGSLKVSDLFVRSSLEYIQAQSPFAIPAETSGHLNLSASQMVLDRNGCQSLTGKLQLQQGEITSPLAQLDIGQIDSTLSCDNNGIRVNGRQQSDMFEATGHINMAVDGRYQFESSVSPTDLTPESLVKGLSYFGEKQGEGRYVLNFNGRI